MRRLLVSGLGLGLALSSASAQSPAPPSRSPVRLIGVRTVDEPSHIVRAQGTAPVPMPMPMPAGKPMGAAPAPMGSTPLPMPKPFGSGPTVTEGVPYPGVTLGPVYGAYPEQPHPTMSYPEAYGTAMPQLDAPLYAGGPAMAADGYGQFAGIFGRPYGVLNRWSFSYEYLLWFTKSASFPALLTTSSPAFSGILGSGDTRVLAGNGSFGDTTHHGGRFTFSRTLGCDGKWALEGNFFALSTAEEDFRADSTQYPVLARPFTNVNQNIPFSELLASPGLATGSALVNFENQVWGAELNLRRRLGCAPCKRWDVIGGFRYLTVTDELNITESFARTQDSPPSIGVPTAISGTVQDQFRTENHFYGGTVGFEHERRRGRWFTSLVAKVSLGQMEQELIVNGVQTIAFDNGTVGQYVGGLLAVPGANIGTYSQTKVAVVPEVGFTVGYQITPRWRAFVGYNFLYVSSVLRPGEQIDPNLDVTRIPNFPVAGATPVAFVKPSVQLKDTDFFAQGVSFGLQWRW